MIAAVKALIVAAAISHGVSSGFMLGVAQCESGFQSDAVNGANEGLYQLSRYGKQREFFARGYDDVWDPSQQANFFAEKTAERDVGAWTCARRALFFATEQNMRSSIRA